MRQFLDHARHGGHAVHVDQTDGQFGIGGMAADEDGTAVGERQRLAGEHDVFGIRRRAVGARGRERRFCEGIVAAEHPDRAIRRQGAHRLFRQDARVDARGKGFRQAPPLFAILARQQKGDLPGAEHFAHRRRGFFPVELAE